MSYKPYVGQRTRLNPPFEATHKYKRGETRSKAKVIAIHWMATELPPCFELKTGGIVRADRLILPDGYHQSIPISFRDFYRNIIES